jgi:hypothetical protein
VQIAGLPLLDRTAQLVASSIYGGAVERIDVSTARVTFVDADACMNYFNDTANGVLYTLNGGSNKGVAYVTLGQETDLIGGMLKAMLERGATRCVTAIGNDPDASIDELLALPIVKRFKFEHISKTVDEKKVMLRLLSQDQTN